MPSKTSLPAALLIIAFGSPGAFADINLLPDPVSSTASTSFSGDVGGWGPQHLYDANPTVADIGTDITGAFGTTEHAANGGSEANGGQAHVVIFDYGASVTFNGFAYAQRNGNGTAGVDKFDSISVWATDTDPGAATFGTPGSLGPADASVVLVGAPNAPSDGLRIFDHYDLGVELTGRYVVFQMFDDGVDSFNPGGNELQLAFDTAPPDPNLIVGSALDFGTVESDVTTIQGSIPINNGGVDNTLEISAVTPGGPDAGSFTVISFPLMLAPGANGEIVVEFSTAGGLGTYSANVTITSNDPVLENEVVSIAATVVPAIPDDLEFLPDPVASSASSSFSGNIPDWGPENLYDAEPTIADLNTDISTAFGIATGDEHASAGGSIGEGAPHVVVFDYGGPVTFSGFAYAQRNGNGTAGVDKFESFNIWATNTDPGPATTSTPDSLGAAQASVDLVGSPNAPSN